MTGTIKSIAYTKGSGICQIVMEEGNMVCADAGPTFRMLSEAFGSVLEAKGHTIEYQTDNVGVMVGFSPVE